MGEKLDTMIKALEQRMDSGVLHDLNATRLHMLIGEEMVKKSIDLPDDMQLIEIIEKAMQKYFRMSYDVENIEEEEEKKFAKLEVAQATFPEIEPEVGPKKSIAEKAPIQFKLNIKKNSLNHHVIINKVPLLFSPAPLNESLADLLSKTLNNESDKFKAAHEEVSFKNSHAMLSDVINQMSLRLDFDQKIRLGFILFKLLGYGDFQLDIKENRWVVTINPYFKIPGHEYLASGFTRGVFYAADEINFSNLEFQVFQTVENTVISVSR